jgi:hypothetical protein
LNRILLFNKTLSKNNYVGQVLNCTLIEGEEKSVQIKDCQEATMDLETVNKTTPFKSLFKEWGIKHRIAIEHENYERSYKKVTSGESLDVLVQDLKKAIIISTRSQSQRTLIARYVFEQLIK